MSKRLVEGKDYHVGSGNVFADMGLSDADELKEKAEVVTSILKTIRERSLTQAEAGRLMEIPQPHVSDLFRGKWHKFSLEKLIRLSRMLGNKIELAINPPPPPPTSPRIRLIETRNGVPTGKAIEMTPEEFRLYWAQRRSNRKATRARSRVGVKRGRVKVEA